MFADTSRDKKSHVDHDVTFSFKVTREGHVIGNSWNDFLDLKNLGNNKKIQCGRTNTSRDNKSHVDHDLTSSFKVTRKGHVIGNSWNDFPDLKT